MSQSQNEIYAVSCSNPVTVVVDKSGIRSGVVPDASQSVMKPNTQPLTTIPVKTSVIGRSPVRPTTISTQNCSAGSAAQDAVSGSSDARALPASSSASTQNCSASNHVPNADSGSTHAHAVPATTPPLAPEHSRTVADASQRRQKFAESPQDTQQDQSVDNHSTEGATSDSVLPSGGNASSSENPEQNHVSDASNSQSVNSSNHTNVYTSSVSSFSVPDDSAVNNSSPDSYSTDELSSVDLRRRQRPLRQAQSDIPVSRTFLEQRRCSQSLTDAKELAYTRLMAELSKAQRDLQLRDEECEKLMQVRTQMEHEINELTAALFTEANKMVQDANIKRMNVEKRLDDALNQVDILKGEVAALKHLVVTSTPSTPNKHLHPQIADASPKKEKSSKPFWKSHKRSTSHHQFTSEARAQAEAEQKDASKVKEMDTVCFDEFQRWKLSPQVMDPLSPFLARVFTEDIQPCLHFNNKALAERVLQCVQHNTLSIEPIPGDSSFPRKCTLSDTHKLCNYKIKLGDESVWYSISQMCRNRIAAVCDFYTYIRYISQGLVKSSDKDIFQEIVKLRLQMATARLGC